MLGCNRQIREDGFKKMPFGYLQRGDRARKENINLKKKKIIFILL